MPPFHMGTVEWAETFAFWLLALILLAVFALLLLGGPRRRAAAPAIAQITPRWRAMPETRLVTLALPLELLWEIAQFPLYDVWHQNDWGYILYGLAHCTLGDLLILLAAFWIVAALRRDRRWFLEAPWTSGAAFTLLAIGYTIFSEIHNVRVKGTWGYTELMPIVPYLEVGAMPLLQWVLIPPVLISLLQLLPDATHPPPR